MAHRIVAAAVATGVVVAGCGGVSSSSVSTDAPSRLPVSVRCGVTPVYGGVLRPTGTSVVRLPGAPDGIAATPDGRFAFVALQSGPPRIAVIARVGVGARLLRTIPIPAYASGVRVTADGRYVLAAAGRGAVVLDAAAATAGAAGATGASGVVLGSLAAPARVAGSGPGAAEVAVSPDSRYAFVTLEGAGVVAVFDLRRGFGPAAYVGAVRVGAGALGIVASPDGRWLYEVSESGRSSTTSSRGVLNVIDLARAVRDPRSAVVAAAPAPCAPVRVAASPDGATIWVTARDGNQLLGYSASALRTDPARALVSATAVGSAPLGVAVTDGGRTVLVADSNLSHSVGGRSAVTVVDVSADGHPVLAGSVSVGSLADAIAAPSAGGVAFVTSSASRTVAVLPVSRLR
jgi:DNA-binding beta-propeller fold protein YncE